MALIHISISSIFVSTIYVAGGSEDVDLPDIKSNVLAELVDEITTVEDGKVKIRADGRVSVVGQARKRKLPGGGGDSGGGTGAKQKKDKKVEKQNKKQEKHNEKQDNNDDKDDDEEEEEASEDEDSDVNDVNKSKKGKENEAQKESDEEEDADSSDDDEDSSSYEDAVEELAPVVTPKGKKNNKSVGKANVQTAKPVTGAKSNGSKVADNKTKAKSDTELVSPKRTRASVGKSNDVQKKQAGKISEKKAKDIKKNMVGKGKKARKV